jgi:hypothetical protein
MTRGKVLLLIIFSSSIVTCVHKQVGIDSFVVTKDGDGNLQSEIHYINDTVMHGLAKYYYYPNPKNVLKDEIEFKNGVKEGWHRHYRKDGTLESKIQWKNNLEDGENYWYYENGILEQKTYRICGKQYGDAYYYYPNGKLKLYNCLNFWGENIYALKFDEQANKIKEEGVVFSPEFVAVYTSDSTQTPIVDNGVKASKEIVIKTTVAQPPQTKTIIKMGELNKGNMMELPIENYTATYKQIFTEAGKHILVIVGEIKDLKNNLIKRDSIAVKLNVIK